MSFRLWDGSCLKLESLLEIPTATEFGTKHAVVKSSPGFGKQQQMRRKTVAAAPSDNAKSAFCRWGFQIRKTNLKFADRILCACSK